MTCLKSVAAIFVLCFSLLSTTVWAFSATANVPSFIDISETTPRNVVGLREWANKCGVATCEGFRFVSDPIDEQDWSVSTTEPLSANEVVVKVPSQILVSSAQIDSYLDYQHQESFRQAEQVLSQTGLSDQIPLFRLFVILLIHYEMGNESPYFAWLNSLPRRFYNGVAMTSACFECLPPYVRYLSERQRDVCGWFQNALAQTQIVPTADKAVIQWAYCVVVTRSLEVGDSENAIRVIAPMADMFNHASSAHEAALTFDAQGNCIVYAVRKVPAGTRLRLCYGDPTNPSIFFANYGFLDKSSPATFCKLMHLQPEMKELGLEFSDLLFYKDSGEVSSQVWDLLLYSILKHSNAPQEEQLRGFYEAYIVGQVESKNLYHQHYFSYTLRALSEHVDGMLDELENLSRLAKSYDIAKHPRLSLILKHNAFVKSTFLKVKANLDAMSSTSST